MRYVADTRCVGNMALTNRDHKPVISVGWAKSPGAALRFATARERFCPRRSLPRSRGPRGQTRDRLSPKSRSRQARLPTLPSALSQALLLVAQDRRQHVLDDAALAGLDLGGDRHAGRELDQPVVDLHARLGKRDARRV